MADNFSQLSQEELAARREAIELQQKELELEREKLEAIKKIGPKNKQKLEDAKRLLAANEKELVSIQNIVAARNVDKKEFASFSRKFFQQSKDIRSQLKGTSTDAGVYLNIGREIAKQKAIQLQYADDESEEGQKQLANAQERESVFSNLAQEALSQAKAAQKAEDDLRGVSDIERQIKDIKEDTTLYTEEQKKQLIEQIQLTEKLRLKEERLKQIKEEQQNIMDALPDGLKSSIDLAKKFGQAMKNGAGPMVLLASLAVAALASFTKLEESAKEFRQETGLTNSQMSGIRDQTNQIVAQYATLGVEAKNVLDSIKSLKSEFSDVANFSTEVVGSLTVLSTNFGVSAENAAKVQSQLEAIGGLSSETAANVQMQLADMAKMAGVAPSKVFADIAENAEITSTLFKGDINLLAKQAIEARRLGTNLKSVAETAEKLLDFESGIEEELVAATFVGGQFNLSRARALAFEGKIVEAQKETLAQIQRSGDFRKKDYFTQQQLAKAAGMSVEEINKQLNAQEKLSSLNAEQRKAAEAAIEKGLDITNINADQLAQETEKFSKQQEMQSQLEKVTNAFQGMASVIGTTLIPVIDGIGMALTPIMMIVQGIQYVFGGIGEAIGKLIGPLGMVGKFIKGIAGVAIVWAAYSAAAAIATASSLTGLGAFVAPILAAAAALAIVTAGFGLLSKIGDLDSPAKGKTMVSTKEGGLFELSPNDDIAAGPGISKALNNQIKDSNVTNNTDTLQAKNDNVVVEIPGFGNLTTAISNLNNQTQTGNIQTQTPESNLGVLSAPLNAMINEIKALRGDLLSGKIAVYMDTAKVTSNISKNVDQSTRNSYNLGSA